ncbi:MAG: ATP-binding cassette domain-containing protein [Deltaproteobacteria bacterium]|nr:ATP-binding cassette domain-containing protein [Deltaproteobacteria bacterium]
MIKIENLYKSFDGLEVLRGVNLEVGKGRILALIGKSGCGKSVLLKHVAGLMKPDKGRVLVDGHDMCCLRGRDLFTLRNRLGFLFQSGALFDSMSIFDNVAFPLREKTKLRANEITDRVMNELEQVGLLGAEEKFPSQLSGGMVKRAAMARALAGDPEIMLFDEPTTGLDPLTGQTILDLIDSCHRRLKFTGIMVTHEVPKIFEVVDAVAMIDKGEILLEGTAEEILKSENSTVKAFVTGGRPRDIE